MIQAPTNEKDSLNIQEVKNFVNLWLFTILLMLKLIVETLLSSTLNINKNNGTMFQVPCHNKFFENQKGREF